MQPGSEPVIIVRHDPAWAGWFATVSADLRSSLGDVATRIDHIGSTAVPGLDAKPVMDIQISVQSLIPADAFRAPLEDLGYVWRSENPDRTKRYFREPPGARRTHVHVRRGGTFSEQFALLFRDYLREHPNDADDYAGRKRHLAAQYHSDRVGYTNAKGDFFWATIRRADDWAKHYGWVPGPSDG